MKAIKAQKPNKISTAIAVGTITTKLIVLATIVSAKNLLKKGGKA